MEEIVEAQRPARGDRSTAIGALDGERKADDDDAAWPGT
jgi:hypothetical protein